MSETTEIGTGWDVAEENANASGEWLRFETGEPKTLLIRSAPVTLEKDFGEGPRTMYSFKVFCLGEGFKTWDTNKTNLQSLARHRKRLGDKFQEAKFEISKSGTGKATRWNIDYLGSATSAELGALEMGEGNDELPF